MGAEPSGRMVVGVDGSRGSRVALEWAVAEASMRDLRITAVTAWSEPTASTAWLPPVPVDTGPVESWHRDQLAELVREVEGDGLRFPIEPIVVRGGARSALLHTAEGAELLVVGHRGRSEFCDALLGSIARYVVARATCPVVVVRGQCRPSDRRPVVVGFDGSAASRPAVAWAAHEAGVRGVPVRIVCAWQPPYVSTDIPLPPTYRTEAEQATRERLDREVAGLQGIAETSGHVVEGPPARAVVDAAGEAGLVVVGSRGRGGLTGLLLGSVSQHVVTHAPCPVVVVHGSPTASERR